jgi:hypothetical protein
LSEEKATDEALTRIAESVVNQEAEAVLENGLRVQEIRPMTLREQNHR